MRRLAVLLPLLVLGLMLAGVANAASPPPVGPPYPDPVDGQAVYDYAGVFTPTTVVQAEQIVDAIEAQTKAEVAVYTQAKGRDDISPDEAEADAAALMDQWGVGRAGVNDGLVVLFDLDTTLKHGQVQLYAGGGFADRYLTTDELQAIFDEDMAPLLQGGDLDSALLVGLAKVVSGVFDATPSPGSEPAVDARRARTALPAAGDRPRGL